MKHWIAVAAVGLATVALAQSRDNLIPYRTLTWDDFPVASPADDPTAAAHTAARVRYRFAYSWRAEGGQVAVQVTEWTIESFFDRERSWRRPRVSPTDTALLAHEQGHLDISHALALRLGQLRPADFAAETASTKDAALTHLEKQLKARFEEALARGDQQQKRYDRETRHGLDAAQQQRWLAAIAADLRELKRTGR